MKGGDIEGHVIDDQKGDRDREEKLKFAHGTQKSLHNSRGHLEKIGRFGTHRSSRELAIGCVRGDLPCRFIDCTNGSIDECDRIDKLPITCIHTEFGDESQLSLVQA